MKQSLFASIQSRVRSGEPAEWRVTAGDRTLIRRFLPRTRLILLGGGHVAKAVCGLAARLDFAVTVCDDRPAFANTERFPQAETVICDSFENAVSRLCIRSGDYVCVMTRGHRWDSVCLEAVLAGPQPTYLGMIGSQRRTAALKQSLLAEGRDPERIAALHAPIGLPIGAVTPEEIAVSICAELIQHRHRNETGEEGVLAQTLTEPELLDFLARGDRPRAVLLVLSATGSTPAKPGAMMAADRLGTVLGTIGGGCAEAAALNAARRLMGTGRQEILPVDLTNEDAAREGMVCGGRMEVLISDLEPG